MSTAACEPSRAKRWTAICSSSSSTRRLRAPVSASIVAAASILEAEGISVSVADARFAKPLDTALIDRLYRQHRCLITLEQGSTGGFGAMVLHHLAMTGQLDRGAPVRTMTLPDRFIDQASPAQMYAWAGLAADDIALLARNTLVPARKVEIVNFR